MNQGLIPIVSDHHFKRTIVGDDKFVVKIFDAKDYADRIEQLMREYLQALSWDVGCILKKNTLILL